jgi:creatinine amidohydrolase
MEDDTLRSSQQHRYELMRPQEIVAERQRAPIAYIPLGPMEWHGPHLPYGVDMLHAYNLALDAVRETGGVVLPPLPLGTETYLEPQRVRDRGFIGDERIMGMDFPGFILPSLYVEDSAFGVIIHELVRALKRQEFRVISIVNGHGGRNHRVTLDRIAIEESEPGRVAVFHMFGLRTDQEYKGGHAERGETAFMMAYYPETVDMNALPPAPVPLRNTEFGILDAPTCQGKPTPDFTVRAEQDPRSALPEEGREDQAYGVQLLVQKVREALDRVAGESRKGENVL